MSVTALASVNPELPIPQGYRASEWMPWSQINTVAYMLGLTKFDKGDNFHISSLLKVGIANGSVQKWTPNGPGRSPALYRMIWK